MKIYLQDSQGKNYPLSVDDYVRNKKDRLDLKDAIEFIIDDMHKASNKKGITTVSIEFTGDTSPLIKEFQDFINSNSQKLDDILCNKSLNVKYVKRSSNHRYNDIAFYNVIRLDGGIAVKGFAFCSIKKDNMLYVDTVCGTGGTSLIFKSIVDGILDGNYFQEPVDYIGLDSVDTPNTINFYSKLGFRKPDSQSFNIIKRMIKSKETDFESFVDKTNNLVGGKMYLFPPTEQGHIKLKKLKCNYLYHPKEWFDEVQKHKNAGHKSSQIFEMVKKDLHRDRLEGAGLGDFFRGIGNKVSSLASRVTNVFKPKLDRYSSGTQKNIEEYGSYPIKRIQIMRQPIMGVLNKVLDKISFGGFSKGMKESEYDKMFHLGLIMTINYKGADKGIIVEKNAVINVSPNFKIGSDTELMDVTKYQGKSYTISGMLERTRGIVGDTIFFDYDAFSNNCQYFIKYILEGNEIMSQENYNFLFQPLDKLIKNLPKSTSRIAKFTTRTGAFFSHLLGLGKDDDGYELHAVVIKKPVELDEAKSIAQEIIKDKKKKFYRETKQSYRFRNIPKQKFDKTSFRTKKVDNDITLIFGKLK